MAIEPLPPVPPGMARCPDRCLGQGKIPIYKFTATGRRKVGEKNCDNCLGTGFVMERK